MNEPIVRIERGNPDDLELAAVLIALAAVAARPAAGDDQPAPVRWLRRERRTAFVASHSWAAA
ncbi:acyl-CoA carboxylase epsilon subunit [Nocardia sp. alder85J]|uniref:acyl-CoA carboxylase epsilon subunit n=1 Tax=Nocardia sp. alder85J TaxID=2862949 RepID=UPI001CD7AC27|nr:acyl-CoA carboxylase epsilon subunit [Nocardia sp. alder85J]MCX4091558.1 acyl-CoA carboxylase epsilon subunit [Nocardia sp. alder85J]